VAALLGSVYFFNGARFLVAALLLVPFALRARPKSGQWRWMLAAGTILFAASALQQAGLVTTTASNAGFITSLYVVIVPLIMLLGWGERPRPLAAVAVLLAAAGAFLLSTAGTFGVHGGDALELMGAMLWALHVVLLGKYTSGYEPISFSAGQLLVGGALNWIACFLVERPASPLTAPLLGAILYTAVASLGLGYTLQIWGQKRTPPTDAALILSLESVFAAIAGGLVLTERLVPVQIAGCILIVGAAILTQVRGWGRIDPPGSSLQQRTSIKPAGTPL
jgi:drug/metabolite transporter (DMT)-like permease